MTKKQWDSLRLTTKENLINAVFNNQYIAVVNAPKDPKDSPVIMEVLNCTDINGDTAYINIHKTVKIK